MKLFLIISTFLFSLSIFSQEENANILINISIGQSYLDGFIHSSYIPTLGFGIEKIRGKYVRGYANITTIYSIYTPRVSIENYDDNIFLEHGHYLSEEERKRLKNKGIKDVVIFGKSIKRMTIPLSFGLILNPIYTKHHRINLIFGTCISYESYSFLHGRLTTLIYQNNGISKYDSITFKRTEYRHITLGENLGLGYDYSWGLFSIGIQARGFNVWWNPVGVTNSTYETSITFKFKLK